MLMMDKQKTLRYALYNSDFKTLWPIILEKAFAKLKGNYLTLAGGYLVNSVRVLTGCPTAQYITNKYTAT